MTVVVLVTVAAAGCGAKTASVTGKVMYDGKPVTSGAITFYGPENQIQSARIDGSGNYTIARAPVGANRITVSGGADVAAGKKPGQSLPPGKQAARHPSEGPGGGAAEGKAMSLPEKYRDPDKSGLTYQVNPGPQTHDINLAK